MKRSRLAVLGACLLGIAAGLTWFALRPPEKAQAVACADIVAGCLVDDSGLQVMFDRRPQAMQPFLLQVRKAQAEQVHASFSMHGMPMGFNRYRLLPQGDGSWQGQVTLPACVQGRSDWELLLEVDTARYALPFSAGALAP
jgi:hypothetical protein